MLVLPPQVTFAAAAAAAATARLRAAPWLGRRHRVRSRAKQACTYSIALPAWSFMET